MTRRSGAALMLCLVAAAGRAQNAEEAGLLLADAVADEQQELQKKQPRALRASLEPALVYAYPRDGGPVQSAQRLSLDVSLQTRFATNWSLVAANRLDLNRPENLPGTRSAVNTLKEAYLSGSMGGNTILDLGRVNVRYGVALGYNPTDYLRENAVRSVTSSDPSSLRENRLGTVMLRTQGLWNGGSVSTIVAPRLADAPSDSPYSADLGATNRRTRWLFSWTQALATDFSPQWLLYGDGETDASVQAGLNLTRLLTDSCVAHFEGSAGRNPSLLARSQGRLRGEVKLREQLALGVSCSTSFNLSATLEYERNGAALNKAGWRALQAGPLASYLAYRGIAQARQDPPTRDNLLLFVSWGKFLLPQLDLSGFVRGNGADTSRFAWLEARYRMKTMDLAVQWQVQQGDGLSEFGVLPDERLWQVLLRLY